MPPAHNQSRQTWVVQFHNPVLMTLAEGALGTYRLAINPCRAGQIGIEKIRTAQTGIFQICTLEIGPEHLCPPQISSDKRRTGQIRFGEIGFREARTVKIDAFHGGREKLGAIGRRF